MCRFRFEKHVLSALHRQGAFTYSHLILPEPWRRDFSPILQMRKTRLREVNWSKDSWLLHVMKGHPGQELVLSHFIILHQFTPNPLPGPGRQI